MKIALLGIALLFYSCNNPAERTAYETVVAANAFIKSVKAQHPECATGAVSTVCIDITKAVSAKDALIDAAEIYCAGPDFNGTGACNPPTKGTPVYTQALAKLQAATAAYQQTATDLKGAL
jgi:hypothetical protein